MMQISSTQPRRTFLATLKAQVLPTRIRNILNRTGALFLTVLGFTVAPATAKTEPKTKTILAAAEAGDVVQLKRILDANPDAWKIKNKFGNQPLHMAAWKGRNKALILLLDRGADVMARGSDDWTALHYAGRGGHAETCRILLKRGADRDAVSKLKRTAMLCATSREALNVLLNFKILIPGVKDFISAASSGDLEQAQAMLKKTPELLGATGSAGKTAAMEAAAHDRVELLKWLIESGADINLLTKDREESALYLACSKGHVEVVKLLLKHGAEVNPPPTDESELTTTGSPLAVATSVTQFTERGARMMAELSKFKVGSKSAFRKRLLTEMEEGESISDFFRSWFTQTAEPLRSSKAEIVKLLIAAGAKPDIKGRGAPLSAVALAGHTENVRLLLDAGADPNRGAMGMTPLICAVLVQAPEELSRLLLKKGADPLLLGGTSQALPKGGTSLPLNKESAMSFAAMMKEVKMFRMMFDSLDLKKLTDQQKFNALTSAVGHPDCLKVVLPAGFDVNWVNAKKQTALHLAANAEEAESVRLLLEAGADVRVRDFAGYSPLHNAVEKGRLENVKLLLEEDASLIDARTDGGATPLCLCASNDGKVEIAALLIEQGANVNVHTKAISSTALMVAASWGHAKLVECLIKAGANVNATSENWSVLGAAAMCGAGFKDQKLSKGFVQGVIGSKGDYLRIAELLIKHKADVNLAGTGHPKGQRQGAQAAQAGDLPLATALRSGSVPMVKLLLKHGADPEKPNKNIFGRTPLWTAIATGNQEMFVLMMDLDVNVNAADNHKLTPLHFAAGLNHPGMVKTLLKKGAGLNVKQKDGVTPLMHAVFRNAPKGARALLEAGADRTITENRGFTPLQVAGMFKNVAMIEVLKTVRKK